MQKFLRGAGATALLCVAFATSTANAANGFSPTAGLSPGRYGACQALLGNGKVLLAGGFNGPALNTGVLYNPATGSYTAVANTLSVARGYSTCTVLPSGKVLIAGGGGDDLFDGSNASAAADLYDPVTNQFSATGSMHAARTGIVAALLSTGKVLIAGGIGSAPPARLASAELYDPATGTFAFTGSLHEARDVPVSVVLPNGKVLIIGGGDGSGFSIKTSELYDPAAGTFALSGSMHVGRDDATATLLPGGKVLVVGGIDQDVAVGSAELYDPATGLFSMSNSSVPPRRFHTATLLSNGTVLIAGGVNSDTNVNTVKDAWIYTPGTDSFAQTGSMAEARFYHTATLLPNNSVLVAGGYNDTGVVSGSELYGSLGDMIFKNGFE